MTDKSSSHLRGAKKSTKKAGMLTVVQRYVSKYGIREGVKRYKQDGWKQKKASKKVRVQVSNTKQGPRRISEGTTGIGQKKTGGRSQLYKDGDRVGAWTPSAGANCLRTLPVDNHGLQTVATELSTSLFLIPHLLASWELQVQLTSRLLDKHIPSSQDWEFKPGMN